MLYSTYDKNGYRIIKFTQDLGLNSNITELRTDVSKFLEEGWNNFALWFTPSSFLYTRSIAILVQCFELIKNQNGNLAIISPNEDILYTLKIIGFMNFVRVYSSDGSLGQ
jgi:hypothetical protein